MDCSPVHWFTHAMFLCLLDTCILPTIDLSFLDAGILINGALIFIDDGHLKLGYHSKRFLSKLGWGQGVLGLRNRDWQYSLDSMNLEWGIRNIVIRYFSRENIIWVQTLRACISHNKGGYDNEKNTLPGSRFRE